MQRTMERDQWQIGIPTEANLPTFPVLEELETIKTNEREREQDEHGSKHYFIYFMTTYHVLCQALQT